MGRFERGLAEIPPREQADAGAYQTPGSEPASAPEIRTAGSPSREDLGGLISWRPSDFVYLNTAEGNVPLDELVAMAEPCPACDGTADPMAALRAVEIFGLRSRGLA